MNASASRKRPVFAAVALLLSLAGLGLPVSLASGGQKEATKEPVVAVVPVVPVVPVDSPRPLIAVWRSDDGYPNIGAPRSQAPYLRIAIWEDGRVLFAADPKKWSHDLREGEITAKQVATLKKQIAATPVFQVKGPHYVTLHMPTDFVLVDTGEEQRVLRSWGHETLAGDEIDECWKHLNRIARAYRPATSTPVKGRFTKETPRSWRWKVKEAGV